MANSDIVDLPGPSDINTGLTSAGPARLLGIFGTPGPADNGGIASVTSPRLRRNLVETKIEGLHVEALAPVADLLRAVFNSARDGGDARLLTGLKTQGTLVLRGQRTTKEFVWSLHSFGIAIDLYYGDAPIRQGDLHTYRGILELYRYFHEHGFFWGAGYKTKSRRDSMHFELSAQSLAKIKASLK